MQTKETLLQKIHTKNAKVAVIGLGYVGLTLATILAEAGFTDSGGIQKEVYLWRCVASPYEKKLNGAKQ